MANREKAHSRGTCAHGYAGIASTFAALAHRKLKRGGVLALVLPLSAAAGMSWQMFREMLATEYTDLTVVSIAAASNDQLSAISADTDIAECLVLLPQTEEWGELRREGAFCIAKRSPPGTAAPVCGTGKEYLERW